MLYLGLARASTLVVSVVSIVSSALEPDGAVDAHLLPLIGLGGPVDKNLPAAMSSDACVEIFRRVDVLV